MNTKDKEELRKAIDRLEEAAVDYGYYSDDVGPAFDKRVHARERAWEQINKILETE